MPPPAVRRLAAALSILGLGLTVAACGADGGSAGVTEDTISLGATNTLAGAGSGVCRPLTEGASAWFDHVNAAGGVRERQIEFQVLDDGYAPERAIGNVRSLLGEPVLAMVGACGTSTAAAIADPLDQAGVPYLFPYVGLASVVEPPKRSVFSLVPLYERQVRALVPHGFDERGAGSVFVVANQWAGYEDSIRIAEEQTIALGGRFLGSQAAPLGTNDYTPIALQIKQQRPDFVVVNMGGTDAAKFVNALVDQGALPAKAMLGVSAMVGREFLSSYNPAAEDKVIAASVIQLPPEPGSECATALDTAGLEAEPMMLLGCAVGQATTTALEQAPELTRDGIIAALEGWDGAQVAPGVLPPVSFAPDDHLGLESVYLVRPQGREFHTVAECPIEAAGGACEPVGDGEPDQ